MGHSVSGVPPAVVSDDTELQLRQYFLRCGIGTGRRVPVPAAGVHLPVHAAPRPGTGGAGGAVPCGQAAYGLGISAAAAVHDGGHGVDGILFLPS